MEQEEKAEGPQERSRIVIDPDFQYSAMTAWAAWTLLYAVAAGAILVWMYREGAGRPPRAETARAIGDLVWRALPILLALLAAMAFYVLVLTHRVAGPARRLSRLLERMGRGERPGPVGWRRNDCLQDVAEAANALVAGQRRRELELQAILDWVRHREQESDGEMRQAMGEVARKLDPLVAAEPRIARRPEAAGRP